MSDRCPMVPGFNSVNWKYFKASDMPVNLTQIRFNVQARPYDQKNYWRCHLQHPCRVNVVYRRPDTGDYKRHHRLSA
nr:hypothetical protein [Escherichia coli]